MWKTANESDRLDWVPGTQGKGIIDEHGHVHSFDSEEYEMHHDYLAEHQTLGSPQAFFYIEPDGGVDITMPNKRYGEHEEHARAMDHILEADPQLHEDLNAWRF